MKAMELLGVTDKPVTVICYEVGFGDLRQFERAFQEVVGCPPARYRRTVLERRRTEFLENKIGLSVGTTGLGVGTTGLPTEPIAGSLVYDESST